MTGRKPYVARIQIESPLDEVPTDATTTREDLLPQVDGPRSSTERNAQAKGPLSGIVPGGEPATTSAPTTTSGPLPTGIFGGIPSGLPDGIPGGLGEGGQGQSPTLILGGFSILLVPMKGMNMANMASMLSAGQQLGQMVPKPGGG